MPALGIYFIGNAARGFLIDIEQSHRRAGARQHACKITAKNAACTRDNGYLAVEIRIKNISFHHFLLYLPALVQASNSPFI